MGPSLVSGLLGAGLCGEARGVQGGVADLVLGYGGFCEGGDEVGAGEVVGEADELEVLADVVGGREGVGDGGVG